MKRFVVFFIFVFSFVFSQPQFLGVYNGNIFFYVKEIAPSVKLADLSRFSYTIYMGHLYIFENFKDYPSAYVSAEKEARKEFKNQALKDCKDHRFSAVDSFSVNVVELKDKGLLFIFSGNILCLD